MITVKFTCQHCGRLMAVEIENLGKQVECPHCQLIVQAPFDVAPASESVPARAEPTRIEPTSAPPRAANDAAKLWPEPALELAGTTSPAAERIEEVVSGAGDTPVPVLEVAPEEVPPSVLPVHRDEPPVPAADVVVPEPVASEPLAFTRNDAASHVPLYAGSTSTELLETPAPPSRRAAKRSILVPIVLMVLIPWALVGPALAFFVGMRWSPAQSNSHPLEWLPDPNPKDGGPERIEHKQELPKKLRTSLKQPLEIGDLRVTPLDVELTPHGDLILSLRIKNISSATKFNPLPESFLQDAVVKRDGKTLRFKPYTFLEIRDEGIYGGALAYRQGPPGDEKLVDEGVLDPDQEMTVLLSTRPDDRAMVKKLGAFKGQLTWRVQLRRGLVEIRGQDRSATAVIGVDFDAQLVHEQLGGRAQESANYETRNPLQSEPRP